ncbi:MAG: phosphate ABC transporter permease subunit PstC [Salinivirgaceae bacterium]|nr:phosphate ABC transporter permease subunit PstC [Salinivirgaceae bacterium]
MTALSLKRIYQDKLNTVVMIMALTLVITTPLIIFASLYTKSSMLFASDHSLWDLLFSSAWEPTKGKFGFLPFIISSIEITILSVIIAAPICFLVAIHLTQYAKHWFVKIMYPVTDILAGIPSVVYGVWGILVVVPLVSDVIAPFFGIQTTGYTLLTGAIVLSIMIIPFILNILIEILNTVPFELTEAGLSLGSTRWQVIKHIILKKAKPGIISAFGLGIARAFGETIAVLMVAGNVIKIPDGLFSASYPLPALIANNYGEMMSIPLYDSALMFGALILFVTIFLFNLVSRIVIYRLERSL